MDAMFNTSYAEAFPDIIQPIPLGALQILRVYWNDSKACLPKLCEIIQFQYVAKSTGRITPFFKASG